MLPSVSVRRADLLFLGMNLSHPAWPFYTLSDLCGFSTSVAPTNLKLKKTFRLGESFSTSQLHTSPNTFMQKDKKQPGWEWYLTKWLR